VIEEMDNKEKNKKYNKVADSYISNCKKYDLDVDASIVISLKTG
jgi:hypothetical protein